MFKNMGDMTEILKQAQELQKKMASSQERLNDILVEGSACGGLVTVSMTAKGEIKAIKIDPSLVVPEEVVILQDLIMSAVNDANEKGETVAEEEMQKVTGGFGLPDGFKLPF